MPRNATIPIDIKENQMKKGTKLSSRMSCPACVPLLRERTRIYDLHINKVKGARRGSAIFIVRKGENHRDCYCY
jgi:hypothetical protein